MKTTLSLARTLGFLLLAAGCFGTSRTQQQAIAQKRTFIPVAAPAAPRTTRFAALKVRAFRTLPPFDAHTFIVRRSGDEFVRDSYNTWIAPPNDLIRVQTVRYLEESRLFSAVYDASSGTLPPLGLEGVVSELYLDFAGPKPAAVVTLRLQVLDERASAFTILFSQEKSGRAEFDASDKTAPSQAFGLALTQALDALTQALASSAFQMPGSIDKNAQR